MERGWVNVKDFLFQILVKWFLNYTLNVKLKKKELKVKYGFLNMMKNEESAVV